MCNGIHESCYLVLPVWDFAVFMERCVCAAADEPRLIEEVHLFHLYLCKPLPRRAQSPALTDKAQKTCINESLCGLGVAVKYRTCRLFMPLCFWEVAEGVCVCVCVYVQVCVCVTL